MERWSPLPTWSPYSQSSKKFQKLLMGVEQGALPPGEAAKTGLGVTCHGFFLRGPKDYCSEAEPATQWVYLKVEV